MLSCTEQANHQQSLLLTISTWQPSAIVDIIIIHMKNSWAFKMVKHSLTCGICEIKH